MESNINEVDRVVSDPQSNVIAQEIADRSITLVRDEHKSVPLALPARMRLSVITFAEPENQGAMDSFIAELRQGGSKVDTVTLDKRWTDADLESVRARLIESASAVIYCMSVHSTLPPTAVRLAGEIIKVKVPVIVISFGTPYLLEEIPNAPAYLAAYGSSPASQRAAARALLGDIDITGKLPVTLPGLYPPGHGLEVRRVAR